MYNNLAKFYDNFTDDIDYKKWTEDLLNKINRYAEIEVENIVDVACGTGNITCRLAKYGYNVVGIDLSSEMLEYASERMRKMGVKCMFSNQDMRTFNVGKKYDSIICTCDGVNYLLEESDVEAFINSAYKLLKKGGVFIFDISSKEKLINKLGNNKYFDIREDKCIFWQNELEDNKVKLDLTMFFEDEDGRYTRYDETQTQRIYAKEDIEKLLTKFEVVEVSDLCYNNEKNDKRIQFVCIKK